MNIYRISIMNDGKLFDLTLESLSHVLIEIKKMYSSGEDEKIRTEKTDEGIFIYLEKEGGVIKFHILSTEPYNQFAEKNAKISDSMAGKKNAFKKGRTERFFGLKCTPGEKKILTRKSKAFKNKSEFLITAGIEYEKKM